MHRKQNPLFWPFRRDFPLPFFKYFPCDFLRFCGFFGFVNCIYPFSTYFRRIFVLVFAKCKCGLIVFSSFSFFWRCRICTNYASFFLHIDFFDKCAFLASLLSQGGHFYGLAQSLERKARFEKARQNWRGLLDTDKKIPYNNIKRARWAITKELPICIRLALTLAAPTLPPVL